MTQEEFRSKMPGLIIHPTHGESFLNITRETKNNEIIVGYKNNSNNNSYGTIGKSFQEIFDSLHPFLVEHGVISKIKIE